MSTVGTTPLLLCLVHLNVRDEERITIQTLHLENQSTIISIDLLVSNYQNHEEPTKQKMEKESGDTYLSITLSILQQIKNELCRLDRPTTLPIGMSVLSLCSTANTTTEPSEGNSLFVGNYILQIPLCFSQGQLSDCKGSLPCVLQDTTSKHERYKLRFQKLPPE